MRLRGVVGAGAHGQIEDRGQAARGVRGQLQSTAVSGCDRGDDGQAQAVPVSAGSPPAGSADEGLAQGLQPFLGDGRAVVGQPQPHPVARVSQLDLDAAIRDVVPHRVAQQVGDGLAEQHRVPLQDGDIAGGLGQGHPPLCGLRGELGQHRCHHVGQIHLLPVDVPRLGLRQVEQGIDGLDVRLVGLSQPLRQGPQLLRGGIGIGQGYVDHRPGRRQRRAQFMRGVRREAAVGGQGGFQGIEHVIVGVGQVADLVAGARQRQAPAEVAGGGLSGGLVHSRQRGEHAAGHHPADRTGQQSQQGEHSQGDREHSVEELGHEGDLQVDVAVVPVDARRLLGNGHLEAAHVQVDQGDEDGARSGHQTRVGQGEPSPNGQPAGPGTLRRR